MFRNALVFDGSGSPRFVGDVAISDGRTDEVSIQGSRLEAGAADEIDLAGLALAPGFIDAQTHDDRLVIDQPDAAAKISQGVTAVVAGNCGITLAPVCFEQEPPSPMNLLGGPEAYSFASMKEYAAAVTNARPAVNVVALIGHSALRLAVMDDVRRPAGRQRGNCGHEANAGAVHGRGGIRVLDRALLSAQCRGNA